MSNFSTYLEAKLLGVSILGSVFTAPATVYLSLGTTLASDGDFFTEVDSGLGYVRLPIVWSAPTSLNDTTAANSAAVLYAVATTPWGIINHWAVHDSDTIGGGNMLYYSDMDNSRDVQTADQLQFQAGELTIRLD